ncbi:UDP-2,3-diacylglucosamine diphosphatase [Acinetobacter sp. ANC 4558]|uniref:UDP-2,3-diacylglucosamine diphosphatase n=1 Tax=Acinetobacter sp. ANC 4558 TaxID=1977876 RepID=UPI000A332442|nr:UDP-2,3-diacylglucosamine diphosphatase [Acinetobacter sp. ANC 4558]OTG87172.1 UDP-2,3-diacylglucosamine diphosphatase [Acinetobacter sp. ANC 4558]
MTYLFISDLHLSPEHPQLIRGFLKLLNSYQHKNTHLYILGDWFNAWIGDDYTAAWLDEIIEHLRIFTKAGNQVYFQVGNRDFALNQTFLNQFSGHLLPDIYNLHIGSTTIRLEHGDALCTDDISYQRFRKIIRNPLLIAILRKTPLSFRKKLVNGFRKKSIQSKELKAYDIMDVNQRAVFEVMDNIDLLIHGHTHRPEIHQINQKKRIVLGDWREHQAKILEISSEAGISTLQLIDWDY